MEILLIFVSFLVILGGVDCEQSEHVRNEHYKNTFDEELYKTVLDEDKCYTQLKILTNHTLRLKFIDATGKLPSGMLGGNLYEFGDYFECLAINQIVNQVDIQGKYCALRIPLKQDLISNPQFSKLADMTSWFFFEPLSLNDSVELKRSASSVFFSNVLSSKRMSVPSFYMTLGVCIPHACTTQQVIDYLVMKHISAVNLKYAEVFCRLPNDKPYTIADYVAFVVFSTLGVITIVSTSYDIYNVLILKRDPSQVKKLYRSFSVYTNTRRLVTFNEDPGALKCVDGIRTISMLWVVLGHTYFAIVLSCVHNIKYVKEWNRLFTTTWLRAAYFAVDTFFFLSGMLSVYRTIGKFNRGRFIRNIHFYYILRLLRMFPLLAAMVLLQASLFHHASDGPNWTVVARLTDTCKKFWWSTLLHIQNIVKPIEPCIPSSWYLAVDVQLHILSPLVIIWMFGKAYMAWIALSVALILSLIASSYHSFMNNFGFVLGNPKYAQKFDDYITIYYSNTTVRASPFIIGMAFGYLMHQHRNRAFEISRVRVALLWLLAMMMLTFCVVCNYPAMHKENDLQTFENILNSYARVVWACGLGWVIFACVKGYGGPINWFLSLDMWKLPARLSYGVYIIHMPLILIFQGGWIKTHYFSDYDIAYRFMANTMMGFTFSFFFTIFIDSPFSVLQTLFLSGKSTPQAERTPKEPEKSNVENNFYKTRF